MTEITLFKPYICIPMVTNEYTLLPLIDVFPKVYSVS